MSSLGKISLGNGKTPNSNNKNRSYAVHEAYGTLKWNIGLSVTWNWAKYLQRRILKKCALFIKYLKELSPINLLDSNFIFQVSKK